MGNHIQATLNRYIDFSDVDEHNANCPDRGLYVYIPGVLANEQSDIQRWT